MAGIFRQQCMRQRALLAVVVRVTVEMTKGGLFNVLAICNSSTGIHSSGLPVACIHLGGVHGGHPAAMVTRLR